MSRSQSRPAPCCASPTPTPPYPGLSKRYYGEHPDYAGEVDHAALVEQLGSYDGWALSTSAASLPAVLALCPPLVRVGAWVRGERPTRKAGPLNAWEPVIFYGGRAHPERDASPVDALRVARSTHDASRDLRTTRRVLEGLRVDGDPHDASHLVGATRAMARHDASVGRARRVTPAGATRDAGTTRRIDALVHGVAPRLTDPDRVTGAKPATFSRWMFDLLGAEPQDELHDLFPGSGGIMRAWDVFRGV